MADVSDTVGQAAVTLADEGLSASEYVLPADSEVEPLLSVVLPTLNEEAGIEACIDRITETVEELQIPAEIIVTDSSTDRTPELARAQGAIVVRPDESGYGAAYRHAFEHVRGEYVAIGDADCTYDFGELPKLIDCVVDGPADLAIGSRLDGEIKDGAMPALHRYVGNPLLTRFLNAFYDAGVSDAHSGLRVISRDALDELSLETSGMEFASEMIMEAGARDLEIAEVPITYHERAGEATIESFRDGWRHVRFMLVNAPGYLFSVPGALLGVLGVAVMGLALSGLTPGGLAFGPHAMIAGSLLTIVGYQIGSFGVFAMVAADPIRRPSDNLTALFTEHFSLERVATAGVLLFLAGATYAVVMVYNLVASGFSQMPFLLTDILAFTSIVLGLQTVFSAFFMSALAAEQ